MPTMALHHDHPMDAGSVRSARAALISEPDARRLGELLALVADPVRSRILIALGAVEFLSVSDLALALGASQDAVSYALKLLRTSGLVSCRKEGRVVFYRLADGFPHQLVEHCLRQLLTIAPSDGRHR